jgi:hypothetical protein
MRALIAVACVLLAAPAAADTRPLNIRFDCRPEAEARTDLQRRGFAPAANWRDQDGDTWVVLIRPGGEAVFGVLWRSPDGGMQFCGLPGRAQMGTQS